MRTVAVVLYLFLVTSLGAGGQTQAPTGTIMGTVVDADTGAPLAGLRVGSGAIGFAPTDADGAFRLAAVPPGNFEIDVQGGGGSLGTSLTYSIHVAVKPGSVSRANFRVRLEGSVSGVVTDATGAPVVQATVLAMTREYGGGRSAPNREYGAGSLSSYLVDQATTNDRGQYTLNYLRAGREFVIWAFRPAQVGSTTKSPQVASVPTFYGGTAERADALPVRLSSLQRLTDVNISMIDAPTYCVDTSFVRPAGVSVVLVSVMPREISNARTYGQTIPSGWWTSGAADPRGRFRLCGLARGEYVVRAAESWRPDSWGASAKAPVTIDDRDVVMPPITLATSTTSPVFIVQSPPEEPDTSGRTIRTFVAPVRPNSAGTAVNLRAPFTEPAYLELAPNERYTLRVTGLRPNEYVRDIRYGEESALHRPLAAAADDRPIHVTLGADAGALRVHVDTSTFAAAAPVLVIVVPAEAATPEDLVGFVVAGQADINGDFVASGLAPGSYYAFASTGPIPGASVMPPQPAVQKTPDVLAWILGARAAGEKVSILPRTELAISLTARSLAPPR